LQRRYQVLAVVQQSRRGNGAQLCVGLIRDAHRAEELAKVRVQLAALRAHDDELPRPIRRDDERNAEPPQQLREIARVVAVESFAAGSGRRLSVAVVDHGHHGYQRLCRRSSASVSHAQIVRVSWKAEPLSFVLSPAKLGSFLP